MDAETDKAISDLIENKPGSRAEAAKELYRLCAENAELRKDAERGRFMLKNGSWYRNDHERQTRMEVLVPYGSDLSCYATREAAIDAAMKGQT